MIFVDTDAFIALYHTKDVHHDRAIRIKEKLEEGREDLVTSWDVIDETSTKLSFFGTKKLALGFLKEISTGKVIIVFPDGKLFEVSRKIFSKQTSKRVSFTDCTNMAIAKTRNVKTFFSFDRHYVKNGFKLLK